MISRRVTSQDVAKRAGVSRTTVSLVLNRVEGVQISEKTRKRVIRIADELGYVPEAAAQALASRRSQFIGLILSRNPEHIATDAFLSQIIHSLVEMVRQNGMRLLIDIVEDTRHRDSYLELAWGRRIDGILLSGPRVDDQALMTLERDGFPTVLMGELPNTTFCSVDVDNRAAAEMAVAHLLKLGHRRIACITNASLAYTAAVERLAGYRRALASASLPFDPQLVRYGDFGPESGRLKMADLLTLDDPPSAVFVASDVVAFGAMNAIREHGMRVPEDIAVVGFDDVPFARYVDPPLTSIHLPAVDLTRQAVELLLQLIRRDEPYERNVVLDSHLVVRASCGALAAAS